MGRLIGREVHTEDTGHSGSLLALPLLVPWVGADDQQFAMPLDQLALIADFANTSPNFHDSLMGAGGRLHLNPESYKKSHRGPAPRGHTARFLARRLHIGEFGRVEQ